MKKQVIEFERDGCKVHFYHDQEPAISMSRQQAIAYRQYMESKGMVFKERNSKLKMLASMTSKEWKTYIKQYGK